MVTKLLILPIRFCASLSCLVGSLASLLTVDGSLLFFAFITFEVDRESLKESRVTTVEAGSFVLSSKFESTAPPSSTDALSGVLIMVSIISFEASAFKRIFKLCSKTSCASNPSTRTFVLFTTKKYHWKHKFLTIGPTRSQKIQNHGRIKVSAPPVSL